MSIEEVYKITFGKDNLEDKNGIVLSHEDNVVKKDTVLECDTDINIILIRLKKIHTAYKKKPCKPSKNDFEYTVRKFLEDVNTIIISEEIIEPLEYYRVAIGNLKTGIEYEVFDREETPVKHIADMKILDISFLYDNNIINSIDIIIQNTSNENSYNKGIYLFTITLDKNLKIQVESRFGMFK